MTNATQMELLVEGTEYRVMCQKAKELGISYSGIKKDVLFAAVNAQITKINKGEAELPTPEVEEEDEFAGTPEGDSTPRERKPSTPRVKAPKWFEVENAFPYTEGDVVVITSGKDLNGRKLEIVQPSAKKDAVKGYLIHPTNGERQKTLISIDFDRIELASEETPEIQNEDQAV